MSNHYKAPIHNRAIPVGLTEPFELCKDRSDPLVVSNLEKLRHFQQQIVSKRFLAAKVSLKALIESSAMVHLSTRAVPGVDQFALASIPSGYTATLMQWQTFSHETLRFEHPTEWTVETQEICDETGQREGVMATVYTPVAGFWSVTRWDDPTPAEELVDSALAALQEEYPESETESIQIQLCGYPVIGHRVQFWCMDLTNTAEMLCLSQPGMHDLIYWQLEDRDCKPYEEIFSRMTESLIAVSEEE